MNNKLSMLACAALAAFSMSTTAQAETNWSGGVAVVNNYLDRGYSLSDHRPAVQAELGYGTELGLHADLFTSSVHD
ncbi:MAG: hypothetical protein KY449_09305, partial [Proteobacteria bacterium]|nr:hypothetical protein [Pseudomonadota bacterium]